MDEAVRVQGIKREANQSAYKGPDPHLFFFFFFFALLFLQSYLVHATQLQRRPSLHIMQNWAGCAWPRRGQLYKGARRLLRKRKEEGLAGLHIASPLSERRRIYTTAKPQLRKRGWPLSQNE